jgi:hypothetical protein
MAREFEELVLDGHNYPTWVSCPIFMSKLSTHHMCAHDHLFHTHGSKVLTDNQISRIKL